jgi:uncharacterized SAM-binding protein YcdF (DUF218 family)
LIGLGCLIRLFTRGLSLVIAAVLVYLGVTAVQVYQAAGRDQAAPSQAIVVLGAAQYNGRPSADLTARLDHALELWKRQDAPVIVVTGGKQPGDDYTEAGAGAVYLHEKGVPNSALIIDSTGADTWQSLESAAALLKARAWTEVILVSDPFHDARIAAMASDLGLKPLVSPTRTSPIRGSSTIPYYAKETADVALGRVFGYGRLSVVHSTVGRVRSGSGLR